MTATRWNNPTGGFGYHLQALRRREGLWAPFVRSVSLWLSAWRPREDALLLIGPSGGHCLDLALLGRFSRVVAVDFDPLAPWVFRWRARGVLRQSETQLRWDARDYLSPRAEGFTLAPLRELLGANPGAAVLFCNILGQLPLLGDDRAPDHDDDAPPPGSYEHWLQRLPDALATRSWASFHDRLSGPVAPHGVDPERLVEWSTSQQLVERHYALTDDPSLALLDHRTSVFAPRLLRRQLVWEISPGLFHLIEAVAG